MGETVLGNATRECFLHGVYLGLHAEVALTVTQVAQHGPDRIVDLGDILAEEIGSAYSLDIASWICCGGWSDVDARGVFGAFSLLAVYLGGPKISMVRRAGVMGRTQLGLIDVTTIATSSEYRYRHDGAAQGALRARLRT